MVTEPSISAHRTEATTAPPLPLLTPQNDLEFVSQTYILLCTTESFAHPVAAHFRFHLWPCVTRVTTAELCNAKPEMIQAPYRHD